MAKTPLPVLPRVAGGNAPLPRLGAKAPTPPVKEEAPPAEKPQSEPPKAEKPKKSKTKKKATEKKSAIDLALKFAALLDKHSKRLLGLVTTWEGEATPDQLATNNEIAVNLAKTAKLAQQVLLDVDLLRDSGFNPTAVRRGGAGLIAGAKVAIKPKYFEPAAYGAANQFEVVVVVGKFVRLRSADPKQAQPVVPCSWVSPVDEVEVDDSLPEDVDPDADPESAPEADGIEEDGDPDHRLPNEDELE